MGLDLADPRVAIGHVAANRYEILSLLGQGAFGTVYRATGRATGGLVVLKILTAAGAPKDDKSAAALFFRFGDELAATSSEVALNSSPEMCGKRAGVLLLCVDVDGDDKASAALLAGLAT